MAEGNIRDLLNALDGTSPLVPPSSFVILILKDLKEGRIVALGSHTASCL